MCRTMTPLNVRQTSEKNKLEIIFSESPRFFTQVLKNPTAAKWEMQKWVKKIKGKAAVNVYFTEEPQNVALIHRVGR